MRCTFFSFCGNFSTMETTNQTSPQSTMAATPPSQNPALTEPTKKPKKLSLVPLIFLIYFEVSGGPFGEEPAVQGGGPFLAILGFLIFPFIWSVPEALITAELATAYPGNGGFVIWVDRAFGPFWASLMASWKFLSGAINNAAYPVLCTDYLKVVFPLVGNGLPRGLAICFFTLILSFLNYTGLTIVGYAAVALGAISVCPFFLMAIFSIRQIRPHRWISMGEKDVKKDWSLFLNTLFWNLNYWDNASTLAGEVENPQKTYPKALFIAGIFTCVSYIVPLFAAIGAIDLDQNKWENGFLADAAGIIAGKWLKIWVEVGAALSTVGLFEAQLSSSSFQLLGMADLGFLPRFFALRSTWFNTPWVGILVSSVITLGVSCMQFSDIIAAANLLYSLGMLLEFSAFIWLRRKYPLLNRPYRVPLGNVGVILMCLIPSVFLGFVMIITEKMAYVYAGGLTIVSAVAYFVIDLCKSRDCVKFNDLIEEGETGIVNPESGLVDELGYTERGSRNG